MSDNATVLLSGGIDSAACTRLLQEQGANVRCVFVDYGQAAAGPEQQSALSLASQLNAELSVVTILAPRKFGAGEILGRNAFLVLTALMTSDIQSGAIVLGIHAGTRYYDCTPAFLSSIDRLVAEYSDGRIRVVAPFIAWSKRDIFVYFMNAGLSINLTYSCEAGTAPPCGSCASCQDRMALGCFL